MFQYSACGLENVFLKNGYTFKETAHGKVVTIDDMDGLHLAIALDLLAQQSVLLGKQFRFLRNEQGLTQAEMGALLGVDAQTVAAWEKKRDEPVQKAVDIAARAYFMAYLQANRTPTFPTINSSPAHKVEFVKDGDEWKPRAAA